MEVSLRTGTKSNLNLMIREEFDITLNDRQTCAKDLGNACNHIKKRGIKSHGAPQASDAEEIVLIIDNKTEMQIADKFYKGGTGSVLPRLKRLSRHTQ